jgi:hypothetical protein
MFLKDSIMLPVHFTDDNERCHIFLSLGDKKIPGRCERQDSIQEFWAEYCQIFQEPKNPRTQEKTKPKLAKRMTYSPAFFSLLDRTLFQNDIC